MRFDFDPSQFRGKTILVDVDGTLVHDGGVELTQETRDLLDRLSKDNEVYLVSNSPDSTRISKLAESARVRHILSRARKPSPSIVKDLDAPHEREYAVVGNQWLTDGLLARRLGGEFIRMLHVTSDEDTLMTRTRYALDDTLFALRGVLGALYSYAVLMRPRHWVKNILVFSPLFFAHALFEPPLLINAGIAFAAFSVLSSAMYVLNDIADIEQDRKHPSKFFRPLPSGQVSTSGAYAAFFLLSIVGGALVTLIPDAIPVFGTYLALNMLYSYLLKHIAVVDVIMVASFYPLRVIAGALAAGVVFSSWIILCVFFLALFIVLAKRRAELARISRRQSLLEYSPLALDYMLTISAGLSIVSYGLYSVIGAHTEYVVYSAAFVTVAVLRLLNQMLVNPDASEYPETFLFKDRVILVTFLLWVAYLFGILYFL